jgi:hypothetical protein
MLLKYVETNGSEMALTPRGRQYVELLGPPKTILDKKAESMLQLNLFEIPRARSLFFDLISGFREGERFKLDAFARALSGVEPRMRLNERTWRYYSAHLASWYRAAGLLRKVNGKSFEKVRLDDHLAVEFRFNIEPTKPGITATKFLQFPKGSGLVVLNRLAAEVLASSHDPSASINFGQMLQELDSLPHHGLIEAVLIDRLREQLESAKIDEKDRQDPDAWREVARTITALRRAMEEREKRGLPAQDKGGR